MSGDALTESLQKYMSSKSKIYWGIFLFLAGFGLFKSCRPKEGEVEPVVDSTAVSTCIVRSETINKVLYRAYEYDSARTLIRMQEYNALPQNNRVIKRYTFEYDKTKKLTGFRETNLQTRDQSYIYELDYTGNTLKAVRSFRVFNSGPVPDDTLRIVYNSDNKRPSELISTTGIRSKWEYDTAANVKKWSVKMPNRTTDSVVAEYGDHDNMVNIYAFSQGMQVFNLIHGRAHSRRNPLAYILLKERVEVSFQYNVNRVPIQRVLQVKVGNTTTRETVHDYELDCL